MMILKHRCKAFLALVAIVIGGFAISNFMWPFLYQTFGTVYSCSDNFEHTMFNESGVIDTSSRWKRLGLATYIFTAYLDDREPCMPIITVMGFGEKSEPELYGTLVLESGAKVNLGKCKEKRKLNPTGDYELGKLGPYAYLWPLLPHVVSGSNLSAIAVEQTHLVTGKTKAVIFITRPVYSTKTFGVCINSPLFGHVEPQSIIENIEINKVLGAEWFTFYIYSADENVLKTLHEYVDEGTVEVVMNWGKGLPGASTHYFGQTLSINECAYRNLYRVKYLVYADLDEFIVPRRSLGWGTMIENFKIENQKFGTLVFRHAFFFANYNETVFDANSNDIYFLCDGSHRAELPKFLTHAVRSRKVYPFRRKSKFMTKPLYSSIVGVHEMFKHVEDHITSYVVPKDIALLHHYRKFRGGLHPVSKSVIQDVKRHQRVQDERALVYKHKIVAALRKRLCRLNASETVTQT